MASSTFGAASGRASTRRRFPPAPKLLRVIGFDDAPFARRAGSSVSIAGVVCAGTRFEGLLWGTVRKDGWNATGVLERMLLQSKFLPQTHLVLLDGIAFGGFNVVDLPTLAARIARPVVAVMRRRPDLSAMQLALAPLPRPEARLALLRRGGEIFHRAPFTFQVSGAGPEETAEALSRLTDRGLVPEALRLAHLIGGAVRLGESGRRA